MRPEQSADKDRDVTTRGRGSETIADQSTDERACVGDALQVEPGMLHDRVDQRVRADKVNRSSGESAGADETVSGTAEWCILEGGRAGQVGSIDEACDGTGGNDTAFRGRMLNGCTGDGTISEATPLDASATIPNRI